MSEKCVCHINGLRIKDATARQAIEELNAKVDNLEIPESSGGGLSEQDLSNYLTTHDFASYGDRFDHEVSEIVDEKIRGVSGGLTEMQVDDKIANALMNAELSQTQYDEVVGIAGNIPAKLPEKQDLRNMNFVNYDDMVWNELVGKVNSLGGQEGGAFTEEFEENLAEYLERNMFYAMPSDGADMWLKMQFGSGRISADDIVDINYNPGTSTPISEVYAKKEKILANVTNVSSFTVQEDFVIGFLVWKDSNGNEHSATIHKPSQFAYHHHYTQFIAKGNSSDDGFDLYHAQVEVTKGTDSTTISFMKNIIPNDVNFALNGDGETVFWAKFYKLF